MKSAKCRTLSDRVLPKLGSAATAAVLLGLSTFAGHASAVEEASSRRETNAAIQNHAPAATNETTRLIALGNGGRGEATRREQAIAVTVDPAAFRLTLLTKVAAPSSSTKLASSTSPVAKPQDLVSPSISSLPQDAQMIVSAQPEVFSAEEFHAQWGHPGTVVHQSNQVMPRSNYFGLDPNECCDEWAGFCDCEQVSSGRRCRKCSKSKPRYR